MGEHRMVGLISRPANLIGVVGLLVATAACGTYSSDGDAGSLTQGDYDGVANAYVDCVRAHLPAADVSYDANRTYPGGEKIYQYSAGVAASSPALEDVDQTMRRCETEVAEFIPVSASWEEQLTIAYPEAFADIDFELVVGCLRAAGIEIADTSTASLDAAIAADPELYDTCYDLELDRVREANDLG
jgi:hypothetical protein